MSQDTQEPTPEQIGLDYYNSLAALTNNSKPIIDTHTLIAQENVNAATEIVKALDQRLNKAIPNHKIWLLYLLDSIAKNVGPPYTSLFGANIYKNFTNVYSLVDDQTRIKLIKLYETWKVPNPITRLPLFPEPQMQLIDKFLVKATANNQRPGSNNDIYLSKEPLTSEYLIKRIKEVQSMVMQRLQRMPNDPKANDRADVLANLRKILETQTIVKEQLEQVRKQVDVVQIDEKRQLEEYMREQQRNSQIQQQQQQQQQQQRQPQQNPQFMPNSQQQMPMFSTQQLTNLLNLSQQGAPNMSAQNNQFGQFNNQMNQVNPNNSANLLLNFMNAYQKQNAPVATSTPPPTDSRPALPVQQQQQQQQPIKSPRAQTPMLASANTLDFLQSLVAKKAGSNDVSALSLLNRNNPKVIFAKFELTQTFINNHKLSEDDINLIYNRKPNQCSNCSKRFPDTVDGSKEKEKHLDWHFRVNKKLKGGEKKSIQNRAWFLSDDAWIKFKEDEIVGSLELTDSTTLTLKDDSKQIKEDVESKYVIVPDDSEDNMVTCGICREKLNGVFDEALGEWVWKNAISVREKNRERVYHYDCYTQTKESSKRDRSPERSINYNSRH